MKRILLLLLLSVFWLTSCVEKGETYFLRSYVMYYYDMAGITLKKPTWGGEIIIHADISGGLGSHESTGMLKESYDALCEKHNDLTYNRKYTVYNYKNNRIHRLGIDFVSIDVTSDSDFDVEHPAGSSLGDIVAFSSYSLKPYIDSGYKLKCDHDPCTRPFIGLLSELTPDQLILLGNYDHIGVLKFKSFPTLSKTHVFTVTMTADDGRVFTASIDMEFD